MVFKVFSFILYIYIYVCVCVCIKRSKNNILKGILIYMNNTPTFNNTVILHHLQRFVINIALKMVKKKKKPLMIAYYSYIKNTSFQYIISYFFIYIQCDLLTFFSNIYIYI